MNQRTSIIQFNRSKSIYYQWLDQLSWTYRVGLALLMAAVMGLAAQVRIPLPFTPVPLTGQVMVVLLSGIVLRGFYGGLSMTFYLLLGFAGVPWFTGGTAGSLLGPTTGYLVGFIPAALFIGRAFDHDRRIIVQIGLMMAAVLIIYLFGALHFAFVTKTTIARTLYLAVLPFIPLDLIKGIVAALIGRAIAAGRR
jgi:biotin transport system substrate-specific component